MKNLSFILIATLLATFACKSVQEETVETWWVNSALVDCSDDNTTSCFEVQQGEKIDSENWQTLNSSIQGFDFEPGNIYQIEVKSKSPAEATTAQYELVKVLSKETDPGLRLSNIWKVIRVGEIENPKNVQTEEALVFEFDATARTFSGDVGCNRFQGGITKNDGQNLVLSPGPITLMVCENMEVEQTLIQALTDTRSYKVENNQLFFMDESGENLVTFQAVD